jgi:hypothetical protein
VISILTFMLFVWGTNIYQQAGESEKALAVDRINRIDTIFQLTAVVGIVITAALAWRA